MTAVDPAASWPADQHHDSEVDEHHCVVEDIGAELQSILHTDHDCWRGGWRRGCRASRPAAICIALEEVAHTFASWWGLVGLKDPFPSAAASSRRSRRVTDDTWVGGLSPPTQGVR